MPLEEDRVTDITPVAAVQKPSSTQGISEDRTHSGCV